MKFKKKSIEAFKYDGDLINSDGKWYVPEWAVKAFNEGVMYYDSMTDEDEPCELFINTSEGRRHVSLGDYVIKGENDELFACNADIFM